MHCSSTTSYFYKYSQYVGSVKRRLHACWRYSYIFIVVSEKGFISPTVLLGMNILKNSVVIMEFFFDKKELDY
jgi:hypothetical protein